MSCVVLQCTGPLSKDWVWPFMVTFNGHVKSVFTVSEWTLLSACDSKNCCLSSSSCLYFHSGVFHLECFWRKCLIGSYWWVVLGPLAIPWVALDWVHASVGWVVLDIWKWTHAELCCLVPWPSAPDPEIL